MCHVSVLAPFFVYSTYLFTILGITSLSISSASENSDEHVSQFYKGREVETKMKKKIKKAIREKEERLHGIKTK